MNFAEFRTSTTCLITHLLYSDFLITKYIFNHSEALTPGKITDLRSALVCNATFGSLSVRYGFHKHLLYFSSAIQTTIETFASLQSSNNHQVRGQVSSGTKTSVFSLLFLNRFVILLQLQLNERDCRMATDVEVPKVLGDIFESICGAIFIDSGMNLHLTWEIFYSLLKTEIGKWKYSTWKEYLDYFKLLRE